MVPDNSRIFKQSLLWLFAGSLFMAGCAASKPKDAIPVVGPPPPRYSLDSDSPSSQPLVGLDPEANRANSEFINVSLDEPADKLFTDTRTVAYVNGEPILASEVLEPYAEKLAELRQQAPPEQFEQLRLQLIERDLPIQIDNRLLIQGFKSTLKKPQQDMLDNAVSQLFNEEIVKLKSQFNVHTDIQLEMELHQRGSSLASLERAFGNRVMAAEFLRSKAGSIPEPSRRELLEAYEQRKQEEYFRPARVRWQQILISHAANGGKQGAVEKLTQVAQDLRSGMDFADVAKKYSDGPGSAQGGYWDWMQKGSLADQAIEDELFSMPIGQISDVLVSDTSFQLVRVLERENEHYIPFDKVQDSLKDKLKAEYRKAATESVMQELRNNAVIQTMFDEPELTDAGPARGSEITPLSHHETSPEPFAEPATQENPFARREQSTPQAVDNPFASDSPFYDEPAASREESAPFDSLTGPNPFE